MFWNERAETMPREELERLQLERLQKRVKYAYERVPFYRKSFQERGVVPEDIRSLSDLAKLPFITKQDFQANYPLGLLAVPLEETVRLHASSGTTGKPMIGPYTANDLEVWTEVMARTLVGGGLKRGDIIQNAYGYGLFTGGLGVHQGAERIGATLLPTSVGNSKRQVTLIRDLGVDALACTPSYALIIAETAQEDGVDLRSSKLRVGFFGAEPWSERMRQEIEAQLGLDALDIFGMTEMMGPGVAAECLHKSGMHINEDHFLPEIVDPESGQPLPPGQRGELVLTALSKEALPVIRFRTRDITSLNPEPCPCGRTFVRMSKISGRTDDMLIVRGVNVFPSQIESALLKVDGVEPQYQIVVERGRHLDDLEIWVEVSEAIFTDEMKALETLERRVQREVEGILGIEARIKLVEPRTIARSEGKAKRVIDRRDLGFRSSG
jgi:phenylacetate-CoA ligase